MEDEEVKKWTLGISAKVTQNKINPEVTLTDQIDENQKAKVTVSPDKVYVDYEMKF